MISFSNGGLLASRRENQQPSSAFISRMRDRESIEHVHLERASIAVTDTPRSSKTQEMVHYKNEVCSLYTIPTQFQGHTELS
ncbi:hypothetical protein Y1Q_0002830 [Alligator mississippiensis]|uniref:Uncharacterized protein n=1 Tax=Alligator mississippiensis TaxID=8496 RepID=A0A151NZ96_ALLMI|nr:hypothetical protein Y1Q_0002830 [Alligator mississippiensis]